MADFGAVVWWIAGFAMPKLFHVAGFSDEGAKRLRRLGLAVPPWTWGTGTRGERQRTRASRLGAGTRI